VSNNATNPFRVSNFSNRSNPFRVSNVSFNRGYYVDARQVKHFKPRGFKSWFENPRNVMICLVVGTGVGVTVYYGNVETIPYTKRKHLVLLSKSMETSIGESQFQNLKEGFKGRILPAMHPESIVVFTGLLKHFRTDEELATIIGHESVEKLLGSYVIIAKVCEQNAILLVGSDSSSAVIKISQL
nr:M48 family peptidase [Tanacetum cinerariifolium]